MRYKTLFEGSGIHHSNSGLQITHDLYRKGFFMLVFDLTPYRADSGHSSNSPNRHTRIELRFEKALPDPITYLLYLEYDNSICTDFVQNVSLDY